MKHIPVLLTFFIIFVSSCKKDDETDYRNNFVGNYNLEIKHSYQEYSSGFFLEYLDSIYFFDGSVTKSNTNLNKIVVNWGTGTIATINGFNLTHKNEMIVDSQGSLSYPELDDLSAVWLDKSSKLTDDSILFKLGLHAGAVNNMSWDVKGVKE